MEDNSKEPSIRGLFVPVHKREVLFSQEVMINYNKMTYKVGDCEEQELRKWKPRISINLRRLYNTID
jgi:hypothetical protein